MFRPSDKRSVEAAFAAAIQAPYEAETVMSDDFRSITVRVVDPARPDLTVASCQFGYVERRGKAPQPDPADVQRIAASFARICAAYTSPPAD